MTALKIMGILNVTPDSFSDGGEHDTVEKAIAHAAVMVREGADIIDVGGESTGPGSPEVSLEEELARVVPVIEAIHAAHPEVQISVDTWKAEVARQAIEAGASMVNDVTALRGDPEMAGVVAGARVPVVLMYSKDSSARTKPLAVEYNDVVVAISRFLEERIGTATRAGIDRSKIIIDPGMGAFVSSVAKYSLEILERLREFESFDLPILVGASRKSFIREIWGGETPDDRLEGSLEAAKLALRNGASILRVHDVAETARLG